MNNIKIGDIVYHRLFGYGKIQKFVSNGIVRVFFFSGKRCFLKQKDKSLYISRVHRSFLKKENKRCLFFFVLSCLYVCRFIYRRRNEKII